MCNSRHMLEWELPGCCNHVVCTVSGQCAYFEFNVPVSSYLQKVLSATSAYTSRLSSLQSKCATQDSSVCQNNVL